MNDRNLESVLVFERYLSRGDIRMIEREKPSRLRDILSYLFEEEHAHAVASKGPLLNADYELYIRGESWRAKAIFTSYKHNR